MASALQIQRWHLCHYGALGLRIMIWNRCFNPGRKIMTRCSTEVTTQQGATWWAAALLQLHLENSTKYLQVSFPWNTSLSWRLTDGAKGQHSHRRSVTLWLWSNLRGSCNSTGDRWDLQPSRSSFHLKVFLKFVFFCPAAKIQMREDVS